MERLRAGLTALPEELKAAYAIDGVDLPVPLYEGDIRVRPQTGQERSGRGSVCLAWLPFPGIRFTIETQESLFDLMDGDGVVELELADRGEVCRGLVTGVSYSDAGFSVRGRVVDPVTIGDVSECDRVLFHLPNFQNVLGKGIRDSEMTSVWRGRWQMQSQELSVVIDGGRNTRAKVREMAEHPGYAITHIGVVRRRDGNLLSWSEARDALSALYYLFSFLRGLRCGPVLSVGKLAAETAWEQWTVPYISRWRGVEGWFPHADMIGGISELGDLFSGYMEKWGNPLWQDPIRQAIHWYCGSNVGAGGVEGSIILTQTALELLSWVCLVEDPTTHTFSKTQFKKMDAKGKISELLKTCGIPLTIPAHLGNLQREAAAGDGPNAIAKIRNALVHPAEANRAKISSTTAAGRNEARELGLWYLEMILLRVFGYNGVYYRRGLTGRLDEVRRKVPWA